LEKRQNHIRLLFFLGIFILHPFSCWSHDGGDVAGGLLSGIMHPVTGLDHVVAMVAVGLWGAQLRGQAIWVLPVVFPVIMAIGGVLGVAGIQLIGIETLIAVSSIFLGLMVLTASKAKLLLAIAMVAFFAIFHGYAHGLELPNSVQPLAYGLGFVIMTGLLHLSGILIGTINIYKPGKIIVRGLGACICITGVYFLIMSL